MDDLRNPRLDDLLRPALVLDPPPAVQQSILAAVLQSAAPEAAVPRAVASVSSRMVSPAAYLLLGAALLAYVALVSWLQGLLGGASWLATMARQILVAADILLGVSWPLDPLALTSAVLQWAPWLALLPVVIFLWERDRAPSQAR